MQRTHREWSKDGRHKGETQYQTYIEKADFVR